MIKKHISLICFVLFLVPSVFFGQTRQFQGQQYEVIEGKWHLVSNTGTNSFPIVENTISVKFYHDISENEKSTFESQNDLRFLRKALTGWHDYQLLKTNDVFETIEQLTRSSLVAQVEIPTIGTYTLVPDDTSYGNQYYLNQSNGININIENAWDITTGENSVTVAVLDSGTEWDHQDLGLGADDFENIFLNSGEDPWADPNDPTTGNGIDDDGNGLIDDWKGWNFSDNFNDARQSPSGQTYFHGTHVAGIVAAKTNNDEGMAGVAGGFNSEGIKILTCAVGITGPNGSVLDDAILYAAETGAKVVQLSLSVGPSNALDDAIDMAHDDFGVVVINASGNGGSSSGVGYPASHPKVLAIGATTSSDTRASFSNHGPDLFMSAPGVGIWSTQLNGQYGFSDGTSFASPIVSGVVGLLFSINPNLTPDEIKQILIDSSQKVGGYDYNWNGSDPGHSRELGYGRIDAFEAVQLANPNPGTCNIIGISATNISDCDDNGTATNPDDDTFTADVTITFTDAPATGNLDLTGDGTASVSVDGLTSPYTFEDVVMTADGGPISVTAEFSDETTCTLTDSDIGDAPDSCSTPVECSITDLSASNISECDDNGTATNPDDDTFTADVTITFTDAPATGTLDLTGDGTASVSVDGLSSPHTFEDVVMTADGGPISVTAEFSDETTCTLTDSDIGDAPDSCSTPVKCSITDLSASNISECDDNGTESDPSDDTFTVDITVTFSEAPSTGTLNLSGDGTASVNVSEISSPYTFEDVSMPADGSAMDVTVSFSDDTACTLNNPALGTAPESCSILGINDNTLDAVAVYPNPTSQTISVLNIPEERMIIVYNLLGQEVIRQKVDSDDIIDVSELSSGSYLLKIEGYDEVLRFMKQ